MMLKTILFGGILFATVCATTSIKIATLEVKPNYDYGLVHKEFRVHYSGVEGASEDVKIKIYKQDESTELYSFDIDKSTANQPKAYYFALNSATEGSYEVDVCVGSDCSGKNPALSSMPSDSKKAKVTCVRGSENAQKVWTNAEQNAEFSLEVIGAHGWLDQSYISSMNSHISSRTEWVKYDISSNPSFDRTHNRLYVAVLYDILHYKELFMKKGVLGDEDKRTEYSHEICERKYLLSSHVHLLDKVTNEVKYRFKKTLYLSPEGKKYFIYTNTDESNPRKVHVEMTFEKEIAPADYTVWVSFCATEKDVVESTVCSNPTIYKDFTVSA